MPPFIQPVHLAGHLYLCPCLPGRKLFPVELQVFNSYKPGDAVPESGIYKVHHDSHRLMHTATLTSGMPFPTCRKCKSRVRFELMRRVKNSTPPFRETAFLEEYPSESPSLLAA